MLLRQVHGCHWTKELRDVNIVDVSAVQVTAPFCVWVQHVGVKAAELQVNG